tara:strand:+ start:232 stop:849 length:618 start_codon:yes stop_codon:yes gene_type:complete
MFELFADSTPNARKISIMLEEINQDYDVTLINLNKGEQFGDEFKKISPFSKIPVLRHDNQTIFESGAILIYLANLSGEFYGSNKNLTTQWLMAQMGYIGPMLGQHHQFHYYNSGKSEFGEQRYFKIAETIYKNLDDHLLKNNYLADEYSIADIATYPWIARHTIHDIGLNKFKNLMRWYNQISLRPAVIKGYDLFKDGSRPPPVN